MQQKVYVNICVVAAAAIILSVILQECNCGRQLFKTAYADVCLMTVVGKASHRTDIEAEHYLYVAMN